jgi:hypothetical protein
VAGAFILRTGLRLVNASAVLGEARRAVQLRLTSNLETVPGQKSALGRCGIRVAVSPFQTKSSRRLPIQLGNEKGR